MRSKTEEEFKVKIEKLNKTNHDAIEKEMKALSQQNQKKLFEDQKNLDIN